MWDDGIAATAQKWAAGCPSGHSGAHGVGENMAWWVDGRGSGPARRRFFCVAPYCCLFA